MSKRERLLGLAYLATASGLLHSGPVGAAYGCRLGRRRYSLSARCASQGAVPPLHLRQPRLLMPPVVSPTIVLDATDLRFDKPTNRFIADVRTPVLWLHSASDFGWRPALSQAPQDLALERGLTKQSTSKPTKASRLAVQRQAG
jgi:hypothetical protein